MTDYEKGEQIYQEFINFRDSFLTEAMAVASAFTTNAGGRRFRPVVVVPKNRVNYWRSQCKRWEEYANDLRNFPGLGIPVSLYEPAPRYITGAISVRCYELPATNTGKISREDILGDIQAMMDRASTSKNADLDMNRLREDLTLIEALPPKLKLRIRRFGYTDLVCNYATLDNPKVMVRATASGLFFDERTLRYGFQFGATKKIVRPSVYDHVKPLPLSIYPYAYVYLIEEVEQKREEMKKVRVQTEQETRREQWRKAAQKRRDKLATEKALIKSPAAPNVIIKKDK